MSERLAMWIDALANNGWQAGNCIGNVMLLIIMAFMMVNVCTNKKLNLMQLSGNMLLITACFLIITIRR